MNSPPKTTYFVLVRPWAVYVKEGEFFRQQNGHREEWGKAWVSVMTTSIEDAREQGEKMRAAGMVVR